MFKKLSIRTKMITTIIIALTIVMTGLTIVTINFFKTEVKDILQQETAEKVAFLNTFLENHLATPITLVENTADEVTRPQNASELTTLKQNLRLKAGSIEGILGLHVAFDGDKNLYSSENLTLEAGYDSNARDWYGEAKENAGTIVVTDPYVDAITGKLIVGVSKALASGDGVVTLDLDLAFLEEIVSKIVTPKSSAAKKKAPKKTTKK